MIGAQRLWSAAAIAAAFAKAAGQRGTFSASMKTCNITHSYFGAQRLWSAAAIAAAFAKAAGQRGTFSASM
jgi:hypothetical protein